LPDQLPAPAVIVAHGFGGSKASVAPDATYLVDRGFAVLTYSARGFGASSGQISMNSPEFEVADASRIIDYLAELDAIAQDSPGDPRVGIAGGSYGGALALLAAGYDPRLDAVAADITWNNLERSLFAQSVIGSTSIGVYKELWAGLFFSAGLEQPTGEVNACGRFTPEWCAAYNNAASRGAVEPEARELMWASSPASITARITAPTLLGGGQSDSLFPLSETDANAEQIRTAHPEVPVKVVWHAGGHDGGISETDRLRSLTADWFNTYLRDGSPIPLTFEVSTVEGSAFSDQAAGEVSVYSAPEYPGIFGTKPVTIELETSPQQILAPAGGVPAAVSSLPGLGALSGAAGAFLNLPLPNQSALFTSQPLGTTTTIIGSPLVRLNVSSETPRSDVSLFVNLRILGGTGIPEVPKGLVAPVRLDSIGPQPTTVEVALPTIAAEVGAGEQIQVAVVTTDQAYRLPQDPAVYEVTIADGEVALPTTYLTPSEEEQPLWLIPAVGIAFSALAIGILAVITWRRRNDRTKPELSDTPLRVEGLSKSFGGDVHAVTNASFSVPKGVVVGLLGPNGAGKTTTMRMIVGLIHPTSGESYIFGDSIHPGSAALARVGCFIEGPGFLPHLSGRENLRLYWDSSGRQGSDPHLDEVLAIAGLGSSIDRKVRTYSQGMRQRLGIAQAMLGMPDLLILDEPTNGLDPPQIIEMRQVLRDYAATGRTILVSSHLLSEVQQTCTEVVVMNHGVVLAQASVDDLVRGRQGMSLEDVFMEIVGYGHEVVTE
jgi:ABC-2 type transport system ATP-binding protein